MSGMEQHPFEIDTHGFTLVDDLLTPGDVTDMRKAGKLSEMRRDAERIRRVGTAAS